MIKARKRGRDRRNERIILRERMRKRERERECGGQRVPVCLPSLTAGNCCGSGSANGLLSARLLCSVPTPHVGSERQRGERERRGE